jgi:hypothetical protein
MAKTLIQIKNEIAKTEGYANWEDFFNDLSNGNMLLMLQKKMDIAAETYGSQFNSQFYSLRDNPPAMGETVIAYSTSAKRATVFTFDGKFSVEYTHWMSGRNLPK